MYLEAFTAPSFNPSIPLHAILYRQAWGHCDPAGTFVPYPHADSWVSQTQQMLYKRLGLQPGAPALQRPPRFTHELASRFQRDYVSSPAVLMLPLLPLALKQVAAIFAREVAAQHWLKEARASDKVLSRTWTAQQWASRPPTVPKAFRAWLNCGYSTDAHTRLGLYRNCTRYSCTLPGAAGNVVDGSDAPMPANVPLLHARAGASSHLVRVPGKGVRHGSYCHACSNGSANVAGDRYGP